MWILRAFFFSTYGNDFKALKSLNWNSHQASKLKRRVWEEKEHWIGQAKIVVVHGKVWRRRQRCTKREKKMRNLFRALIIILSVMWADDFYSYVECGVGELFLSHWSNDERHLLHRLLLIFFYLATKKVKTKQTFSIFLRTQKVSRAVGKKYKCQSQTNS